ncbi:putative capsid protein [Lake Sarah-associated circular virus-28]|uniref:putative capsid protein n=1 Tax=Lake Sarah-associated circular virus-28 TaxID=1685755 RepID=UPI000777ECCE|nr:putative capsid protein [Lake Sarah-associated circular virus-28]ALE29692.1 putative capsid protein [Lake Sarah-associated circular virus-28]ALE29697.1 putative capsid protein [Lake Sarah-associated circular virus-28]ALE29700.1 putative capsid protein [Lake Sarah-associated circular virus-28]
MSAVAHCAVLRNPFSTAVATCKIPDGSAVLSSSSRLSHSKHYSCTQNTLCIALYPGFQSHIFLSGKNISQGGGIIGGDDVANPDLQLSSRTQKEGPVGAGGTMTTTQNANAPSKYRIASQGLRVSLIENSENNDGWFEAIRIPSAYDASDFVTLVSTLDSTSQYMGLQKDKKIFGGNLGLGTDPTSITNWSMNPTYITGKLRDINRHTFMLHRENDMDFVDVNNTAEFIANGTSVSYGKSEITRAANPSVWWVDSNLDTILIRCFGSIVGSGSGMSVHIHTVQHVEEQFEPNNELARYMIKPPVNTALTTAVMNAIRREIKPSIIRAPTGGVSVRFSRTPRTYRRRKSVRRRRYT